ncbi:MAG TPA: serpin family protein, partial [Acidimicrobiia bacterium]|nr:serpin family protein [Acidimicrobiia bacterium]
EPDAVELDLDHELGRVVENRARRRRHRRVGSAVLVVGLTLALATAGAVVASGGGDDQRPTAAHVPRDELLEVAPGAKLATLDVPRAAATSPDVATLVHDNTAFAFDLYRQLAARDSGNLFISPVSISTVLAMTYAGARSTTAAQIAKAAHFDLDPARLHAAFNALDQQLLAPRPAPTGASLQPMQLEIDNSLWAQTGRDFVKTFLETLAEDYGAPVHLLDYAATPRAAADAINAYVAAHTHGRIRQLLSPDDVDALTRFVLVDTVYFKGSWQIPFDPAPSTHFHLLDGSTTSPTMMSAATHVSAFSTDDYDAVSIPYVGGASMRLIVPAAGHFDAVERELGAGLLDQIRAGETSQRIQLTMPKFSFSTSARLDDALQSLGVHDVFSPPTASGGADLTGMSPARDLFVKTVVHQATVAVDEDGTEATAATAAVGSLSSATDPAREVKVDRPFFVVIEDDATHAVLFTGRVTDPDEH